MKIKRFFAKDMRTALAEVKDVLGPEAVIMSNKKVSGGIEIVAAVDDEDLAPVGNSRHLSEDNVRISSHARQFAMPLDGKAQAESLQALLMRSGAADAGRNKAEPEERREPVLGQASTFWQSAAEPAPSSSRRRERARERESGKDKGLNEVRQEVASIRRLLEHQLSGLMWQEVERSEPVRAMVIRQLRELGFSDGLADQLASRVIPGSAPYEAWEQIARSLTEQLTSGEDDILRQGGAISLLGPTGVGKTTTIAKLAARFAARYGADQVALITTDHYRIGAHEQLQTYGRIMGVVVKQARTYQELAQALYQLRHRRLVLVDTAGMGQRDLRLNEQLDTLVGDRQIKIRNYLVLPATAQRRVLQETVAHFRRIPLAGCILTKLDESLSLGDVIDISIQNSLPISYVTDGQRVPEDLRLADPAELVRQALGSIEQHREEPYFWDTSESDLEGADFDE
ncbi:flagellar biosynthesis protein FlhF [Zobellella denitrificans]|jgi:flagellar biosynthesis protein FlhF|uniref:Flagellar biosynthesis protein FlhF n=1 Tax=Zobellella denitrificans TaxID=347534 RepID=A0A231MYP5_9GAMM|nr:flagellar biosynthesis protein FlhF [Zobellella denitrificans]ATG73210.1 flagellar biosynthesis regulator FlhF [Zobellella denitrificans]OXS15140.1 flagellar biosynthesis protein FlhF [Zobellella denitrificans]